MRRTQYTLRWPHRRLINVRRAKLLSHLKLIIGPMFAGKTDTMIKDVKSYLKGDHRCIIVKHSSDTRYSSSDKVVTHDGVSFVALPATRLMDVMPILMQHEVIGIDEGSFFPDIYEGVMHLLDAEKRVVISALDGGYNGELFLPHSDSSAKRWIDLIPLADVLTKITGVCSICNSSSASMTMRIGTNSSLVVIGDGSQYQTVCRRCWMKETDKTGLYTGPLLEDTEEDAAERAAQDLSEDVTGPSIPEHKTLTS